MCRLPSVPEQPHIANLFQIWGLGFVFQTLRVCLMIAKYIYIYIYILHMCTCTFVCMYLYMYMYVYMHLNIRVYVYV